MGFAGPGIPFHSKRKDSRMKLSRRSALLMSCAAIPLSIALTMPAQGWADPPPTGTTTPSVTTTVLPVPDDAPSPEEQAPDPTAPTRPSEPAEPPTGEPGTSAPPETEVPSTTPPSEPSDSQKPSESAVPAPERRLAPQALAAGCQTYPPTTFQVCGRIRDKYNQTGGPAGFLLFPKSNELTNPGNTGKRSEFVGGNIYWSAATDAHPVAHEFLTKWGEKGYETGFLKYPTTDEIVLADGINRRQEYQGGSIYWAAGIGAHSIQGTIRDKWLASGGPGGQLGFPTTDEMITPDGAGRYNIFQKGAIYWHPTTGAHFITQPMFAYWAMEGYETSSYGYPVTDTYIKNGLPTQGFQHGVVDITESYTPATNSGCSNDASAPPAELNVGADISFNTCFGTFDAQRRPELPDHLFWSIRLSAAQQLSGIDGPNTEMQCRARLNKDGAVQSYADAHQIPLNYTWHSRVPGNEVGPEYLLGTWCSFVNKNNGYSVLKHFFSYKFE